MRYVLVIFALLLSACSTAYGGEGHGGGHIAEAAHRVYYEGRDAEADVAAALSRVAGTERRVIVAMGGNWCHDSRGLAAHFEDPGLEALLDEHYEVVYVDVGIPQTGRGRNGDLAERFGVAPLVGTPTVVVLDSDGAVLNREDAPTWRDADSRSTEEVLAYFEAMAGR